MGLVVVVLVVALLLGALLGGRPAGLSGLPLRDRRLVLVALLAQLAGGLVGGRAYPVGLAVSAVLVVAFLARNRGLRGLGLVALGLGANALVVLLNGAMPVALDAAARAGVPPGRAVPADDPRHEVAGPGTRWHLLGDVVPVALPVRPEVVSPGDVLVAAGLGQLVLVALLAGAPAGRRAGVQPWSGRLTRGGPHGQEGPQEARAQEEQGQPRQPAERLSRT